MSVFLDPVYIVTRSDPNRWAASRVDGMDSDYIDSAPTVRSSVIIIIRTAKGETAVSRVSLNVAQTNTYVPKKGGGRYLHAFIRFAAVSMFLITSRSATG